MSQKAVNREPLHCRLTSGADRSVNGLFQSPLPLTVNTYESATRGVQIHDQVAQERRINLHLYLSGHVRRKCERMAKIQFELPDEKLVELEALQKESRLDTRKDLFNTALTLFEWAVEEVKAGRTIASIDEDNNRYREIVMPALRAVAPTGNGKKKSD